jgi:hypothetical protein
VFHSIRKQAYSTLASLAVTTLVLYFSNHKDYAGISIKFLLAFLFYCICMALCCRLFRRSHHKFRVYYSFSERRQSGLSRFLTDYLSPTLWMHNIDYYDFREGKQLNFLNEYAVCAEIEKNLAASDIFVRFISEELVPDELYPTDPDTLFNNIRYNPYTRKLQAFPSDYAKYEVDISYDRFGFTAPYNRFQIVSQEIEACPKPHISTIRFTEEEPVADLALKITQRFIAGYNEKQNRMLSELLFRSYTNKYNQGVTK